MMSPELMPGPATMTLLSPHETKQKVEEFLQAMDEDQDDQLEHMEPLPWLGPYRIPMRIDVDSLPYREDVDIDDIDFEILPLPIQKPVENVGNKSVLKSTKSSNKAPLNVCFTARGRLTSDKAECPYCGKAYANLDSLRKHAKAIHGVMAAVCNICNEFIADKEQRSLHFQSQEHKLRAEEFNRRNFVRENHRVPSAAPAAAAEEIEDKKEEERVIDVSVENLEQTRVNLEPNRVLGTDFSQPFLCPLCPSRLFKSTKQMKRHYMLEHPKTPFKICVHCNRAFSNLADFQRHKREEQACIDPLRDDSAPFRGFQPDEGKELETKLRLLKQLLAHT